MIVQMPVKPILDAAPQAITQIEINAHVPKAEAKSFSLDSRNYRRTATVAPDLLENVLEDLPGKGIVQNVPHDTFLIRGTPVGSRSGRTFGSGLFLSMLGAGLAPTRFGLSGRLTAGVFARGTRSDPEMMLDDYVGPVQFVKLSTGIGIIRMKIGVQTEGPSPVGALDLLPSGPGFQPENFIGPSKVETHSSSPFPDMKETSMSLTIRALASSRPTWTNFLHCR